MLDLKKGNNGVKGYFPNNPKVLKEFLKIYTKRILTCIEGLDFEVIESRQGFKVGNRLIRPLDLFQNSLDNAFYDDFNEAFAYEVLKAVCEYKQVEFLDECNYYRIDLAKGRDSLSVLNNRDWLSPLCDDPISEFFKLELPHFLGYFDLDLLDDFGDVGDGGYAFDEYEFRFKAFCEDLKQFDSLEFVIGDENRLYVFKRVFPLNCYFEGVDFSSYEDMEKYSNDLWELENNGFSERVFGDSLFGYCLPKYKQEFERFKEFIKAYQ